MIDIKVDDVLIGRIDPADVTIGDQIELEEARGARDIVAWLKAHAAMGAEAEAKLLKMPLRKVKELGDGVSKALMAAVELPN
jgi:hypothetical protein